MHDTPTNPNIGALTGELLHLALADVVASESNPRLNLEREPFQELKNSIEENGLLQPILVRPHDGRFQIIGGHRRHAAVVELARENPNEPRFARIAAVVKDVADAQVGGLQLAENLNRADLAPAVIRIGRSNGGRRTKRVADSRSTQLHSRAAFQREQPAGTATASTRSRVGRPARRTLHGREVALRATQPR